MKPLIIKSTLLCQFDNLVHGISTILGGENESPFKFNLSKNIGDDETVVSRNCQVFFDSLCVTKEDVVLQHQVHGCRVSYVESSNFIQENDAMITDKANLYLVVNVADCIPILMFEPNKRITAAVHTGWRGTEKEILSQTLDRIEKDFGVKPKDLFVYFGPSICKNCFEVDYDISQKFPSEFVTSNEKKYLIDLVGINSMVLKQRGIQDNRIQISALCTFEMKNLLHSYRRDKNKSGRMFAVIGMKN